MSTNRRAFVGGATAIVLSAPYVVRAQKKYDDGASDTEIKIGHTCPYGGPASAYGVNGKAIVVSTGLPSAFRPCSVQLVRSAAARRSGHPLAAGDRVDVLHLAG
jgi:hypothetical protein